MNLDKMQETHNIKKVDVKGDSLMIETAYLYAFIL